MNRIVVAPPTPCPSSPSHTLPLPLPPLAVTYKQLYAFSYRPGSSEGATRVLGWGMYDTIMEYGRMGVPNEHWRHCSLNEEYKVRAHSTLKGGAQVLFPLRV